VLVASWKSLLQGEFRKPFRFRIVAQDGCQQPQPRERFSAKTQWRRHVQVMENVAASAKDEACSFILPKPNMQPTDQRKEQRQRFINSAAVSNGFQADNRLLQQVSAFAIASAKITKLVEGVSGLLDARKINLLNRPQP